MGGPFYFYLRANADAFKEVFGIGNPHAHTSVRAVLAHGLGLVGAVDAVLAVGHGMKAHPSRAQRVVVSGRQHHFPRRKVGVFPAWML
jgi:hypothetical protein